MNLPGLRVFRCLRPPLLRHVKIGPSLAKVPLDLALTVTAMRRALADRYDAVHSHEEGAAIGIVLSAALGIPHIYDMHSSLPQQLSNFAYSRSRVLRWIFERFERAAVRHSKVVIVICPELRRLVQELQPGAEPILIENAPGADDGPAPGAGAAARAAFGIAPATPLVVYTGTFEAVPGAGSPVCSGRARREQPGPRRACSSRAGVPTRSPPRAPRRRRPASATA